MCNFGVNTCGKPHHFREQPLAKSCMGNLKAHPLPLIDDWAFSKLLLLTQKDEILFRHPNYLPCQCHKGIHNSINGTTMSFHLLPVSYYLAHLPYCNSIKTFFQLRIRTVQPRRVAMQGRIRQYIICSQMKILTCNVFQAQKHPHTIGSVIHHEQAVIKYDLNVILPALC